MKGNKEKETEIRTKDAKKITRTVFSVVGNVLLLVIIALAVFVLVITITAKKDSDGAATVFGKQLRFVQSSSMEACDQTDISQYKIKSIKVKSCVFIDVIPTDAKEKEEWLKDVKVGDVLTFKYTYTKQETITHRVVSIEEKPNGGYVITLEGDNKADKNTVGQQIIDTSLTTSPNYIIGKVTGQSYVLGLVVYALKTPIGLVCFIIIPCIIIIAFQVMRIVRAVGADRKEKFAAEQANSSNEIEELKRQIALLQQTQSAVPTEKPAEEPERQQEPPETNERNDQNE